MRVAQLWQLLCQQCYPVYVSVHNYLCTDSLDPSKSRDTSPTLSTIQFRHICNRLTLTTAQFKQHTHTQSSLKILYFFNSKFIHQSNSTKRFKIQYSHKRNCYQTHCPPPLQPQPKLKYVMLRLTFKNRASCIKDGHTTTLQMLHFIYFFQQI